MTIIFDDEINVDSVEKFCIDLDNIMRGLEEGETVDLYISTNGGHNAYMHVLINSINKYADKLVIYLTDIMQSCGFIMLWYLRNFNIYALPSFRESMIHKVDMVHSVSNKHFNRRTQRINEDNKTWYARWKELGLSKKDLKRFKNNRDIYFSREQTLELFPNIIEIE